MPKDTCQMHPPTHSGKGNGLKIRMLPPQRETAVK